MRKLYLLLRFVGYFFVFHRFHYKLDAAVAGFALFLCAMTTQNSILDERIVCRRIPRNASVQLINRFNFDGNNYLNAYKNHAEIVYPIWGDNSKKKKKRTKTIIGMCVQFHRDQLCARCTAHGTQLFYLVVIYMSNWIENGMPFALHK